MPDFDFVVAGGGLAGACAALHLREHGRVLVMEKDVPASGASGIGVGLVNPILGRRGRPVWRMNEALRALRETLDLSGAAGAYRPGPTLRPAGDAEQGARFQRSACKHPEHCTWLPTSPFEGVHAPGGVLRIETGGVVRIDELVGRIMVGLDVLTGTRVRTWKEVGDHVEIGSRVEVGGITTRYLILAVGPGFTDFPETMRLRLHQVKGQILRLTRPDDLPPTVPHLAGAGYVVSEARDTVLCGSTYEHRFADLEPSRRATEKILSRVERMFPSIRGARVLGQRTGVRVTVPGVRLPMVGPLPGRRRVWIFTGLGAKGLLTGPLVAKELPAYLDDPRRIPKELSVRLAKGVQV